MAVTQQINAPAEFIQDLAKDYEEFMRRKKMINQMPF